MKACSFLPVLVLALFLGTPSETEAQTSRVTVVKVDRPGKGKVRRTRRRVRRRTVRRTLRRLPAGTRAVVYRNVNYYPVGGRYYLARNGAYVRVHPPVGFRMRTLAAVPVRIAFRNRVYWYSEGTFYDQDGTDYVVTPAPVGAVVPDLPEEAEAIEMDGITNYELDQAVYREVEDGFEVIEWLGDE